MIIGLSLERTQVKLDKKTTPPFAIAAFGGLHNKLLKPSEEVVVQVCGACACACAYLSMPGWCETHRRADRGQRTQGLRIAGRRASVPINCMPLAAC